MSLELVDTPKELVEKWGSKCLMVTDEKGQVFFTKSELSEIMDGAIYKCHEVTAEWNELEHQDWDYNPYIDKYEWINPLIELVPVEDGE